MTITIERNHKGGTILETLIGNDTLRRVYYGYNKRTAISRFRYAVKLAERTPYEQWCKI